MKPWFIKIIFRNEYNKNDYILCINLKNNNSLNFKFL